MYKSTLEEIQQQCQQTANEAFIEIANSSETEKLAGIWNRSILRILANPISNEGRLIQLLFALINYIQEIKRAQCLNDKPLIYAERLIKNIKTSILSHPEISPTLKTFTVFFYL